MLTFHILLVFFQEFVSFCHFLSHVSVFFTLVCQFSWFLFTSLRLFYTILWPFVTFFLHVCHFFCNFVIFLHKFMTFFSLVCHFSKLSKITSGERLEEVLIKYTYVVLRMSPYDAICNVKGRIFSRTSLGHTHNVNLSIILSNELLWNFFFVSSLSIFMTSFH